MDPVAHDYHLRVGSPAIDMGTALPAVTEDLWGDARPQGARWDIGADEVIGCAAPGLVTGLLMAADRQTSTWQVLAGADNYDVVRGDLLALLAARGDFSVSIAACVENDGVDLIATDASLPSPGGALFWLVRATACGLPGSWDSGDANQPTSRDASIASAPSTCP